MVKRWIENAHIYLERQTLDIIFAFHHSPFTFTMNGKFLIIICFIISFRIQHSPFSCYVARDLSNKQMHSIRGRKKKFNKISNYLRFQIPSWYRYFYFLFLNSLDTQCSILDKYIFLYAYQHTFDLLLNARTKNEPKIPVNRTNAKRKQKENISKKILFKDSKSILYCIKFCLNAFSFDFSFQCYSLPFDSIHVCLFVCVCMCKRIFGYQFQNCHGHIFHFVDGYCMYMVFVRFSK